jgi:hypothetical protein
MPDGIVAPRGSGQNGTRRRWQSFSGKEIDSAGFSIPIFGDGTLRGVDRTLGALPLTGMRVICLRLLTGRPPGDPERIPASIRSSSAGRCAKLRLPAALAPLRGRELSLHGEGLTCPEWRSCWGAGRTSR